MTNHYIINTVYCNCNHSFLAKTLFMLLTQYLTSIPHILFNDVCHKNNEFVTNVIESLLAVDELHTRSPILCFLLPCLKIFYTKQFCIIRLNQDNTF